jgi:hypothetical protein
MARLTGLSGGLVFGILSGTYAAQMIASEWRPENQIGIFGMAWSVALVIYFSWQVRKERTDLQGSRGTI